MANINDQIKTELESINASLEDILKKLPQPPSMGSGGGGQQSQSSSGGGSGDGDSSDNKSGDNNGGNGDSGGELSEEQKKQAMGKMSQGTAKAIGDIEKRTKEGHGLDLGNGEKINVDDNGLNGTDVKIEESDRGKSEKDLSEQMDDVRQKIRAAMQSHQGAGNGLGSHMQRLFDESEMSYPLWENFLRPFMRPDNREVRTYQKMHRNRITQLSGGTIPMRGRQQPKQKIKHLLIAIDTSGSIGDDKLSEFYGQIKTFLEKRQTSVEGIVCYWGTDIASAGSFNNVDSFKRVEVGDGGGTTPECVFEWIKTGKTGNPKIDKDKDLCKKVMDTVAVIVYTDGDFYGDCKGLNKYKNDAPFTIWCLTTDEDYKKFITEGNHPNFGKISR